MHSIPRTVKKKTYLRIPIKTRILTPKDDMLDIVREYTSDIIRSNDIIVVSESPLAMTQGRAIFEKDIKVGWLAKLLWRGVRDVDYGVGLRSPTSMQCAVEETGRIRIIFAAMIGLMGKLFGKRGWFYNIAGKQAGLVDAAHTSFIPPYDKTVIKGPINTNQICRMIKTETRCETAIMDINDIGGSWVIGKSDGIDQTLLEKIMDDNPQGQKSEQTPLCLVREQHD